MKFTQVSILEFKPPIDKADFCIWDEAMPGFGIRFRNGGRGHYVIQYWVNGKQGKMSLGHINKVSLVDARRTARVQFGKFATMKINRTFGRKK